MVQNGSWRETKIHEGKLFRCCVGALARRGYCFGLDMKIHRGVPILFGKKSSWEVERLSWGKKKTKPGSKMGSLYPEHERCLS